MYCPKCGARTYEAIGGKTICPECGYGSSVEAAIARQKAELVAIGPEPDLILEQDTWTLQLFYRHRGSKSEGQHGILLKEGAPVRPKEAGEIIETDLGAMKYYLHPEDMENSWDLTGWNFADQSQIRWSWSG